MNNTIDFIIVYLYSNVQGFYVILATVSQVNEC